MKAISFSFTPESTEAARTQALEAIRGWSEVATAGLVKADAKNAVVRRLGTIMVDSEEQARALLARLREVPEVAQAGEPAIRTLA